jgi:hypothetical protein
MSDSAPVPRDLFDRPIFIVSTPRSGSTLLFETLAQAPDLFTTGDESHRLIESIPELIPALRGWDSNRLTAEDAAPAVADHLARMFYGRLCDRDGRPADERVRMLEKTPKNALRVPFFDAIWSDSLFVYLYRHPRQTLASMIRAWQSGRFRTYPRLPGWRGPDWSLLLVPGWRELNGLPVPEIAARQWTTTTNILIDDLSALPKERVRVIDYDAFVRAPHDALQSLAPALGLGWDRTLPPVLPPSRMTLTAPGADKWRDLEPEIDAVLPLVEEADRRSREFAARLARPA